MVPSPFFQGIEDKIQTYSPMINFFDPHIQKFRDKAPDYVNVSINSALGAGAKRVAGYFLFGEKSVYLKSSMGPVGNYY
ncbi:MAG: hypothetical protein ACFE9L_11435 [Candidatus Hodarchaeota archaeon]